MTTKDTSTKLPKLPTSEVIQFNCKAIFILRNPDGKVAGTREQEVSVMQSHFGTTFQQIADQIMKQVSDQITSAVASKLSPKE